MNSFSAKVYIIGVNPYVLLPGAVLKKLFTEAGKSRGPIPVKGTLNKKNFIQTLVRYKGEWRLYLNTPMRKAAAVEVGDTAKISIEYDPKPRSITMHPKLKEALTNNATAKRNFEKLAPHRRKEIVRYISFMKSEQSVTRNVKKAIQHLLGKGRFVGRD